jgi:outer membrane protein assembly factor BamB
MKPKLAAISVAILLGTGFAAVASASQVAAAAPINWGQDGFNKADSGYNAFETAIITSTAGSLNYQWSIVSPLVAGSCGQQLPPIVDNGHLALSDQGGFAVYDAVTGAKQWTWRTPFPTSDFAPKLAATGNTLIAVSTDCQSQSDPSSVIRAFNLTTGAPIWQVSPFAAPVFTFVIDGGVLAVAGGDIEGSQVAGYSMTTGAQLWAHDDADAAVAVDAGGRMLVTKADFSGSYAINVATGTVAWTTANQWNAVSASQDGTRIVATTPGGDVVYVNAATGAPVWSKPGLAGEMSTDATHVYVSRGANVKALNTSNGATAWSVDTGNDALRPVVAGGVVYVPVVSLSMRMLSAATGANLDDQMFYTDVHGHAVVVNGWLYVTNGRILDAFKP